jgi:hypothetical protein
MTGYAGNGPIAQRLIDRATTSQAGMVAVKDYQEMRAARKLIKRGTFIQFGTLPFFFLTTCPATYHAWRCDRPFGHGGLHSNGQDAFWTGYRG